MNVFTTTVAFVLLAASPAVLSLTSYANDFVDPRLIVGGKRGENMKLAEDTVKLWADELAAAGPWTVTSKALVPPSGSKKDYMSWAPYWWPMGDCGSKMSVEDAWKSCTYEQREGRSNPAAREVDDVGAFQDLSDAVLYNSIASVATGDAKYAKNVADWISIWFLDETTGMNPNLNFGQMQGGPDGQTGTHLGLLDLKSMVKIVSGILILRESKSAEWTSGINSQMNEWAKKYLDWLKNTPIAQRAARSKNNHGTFYWNQVLAVSALIGDFEGAKVAANTYVGQQFAAQIDADGEQPQEGGRSRAYHNRAYNIAAMITNARLSKFVGGPDIFTAKASSGATIQAAVEYAMNSEVGNDDANELYPSVAAVASTYGDVEGKYAAWLNRVDGKVSKWNPGYVGDAYFLWNQPLADSGIVASILSEGGGVADPASSVKMTRTKSGSTKTQTSSATATAKKANASGAADGDSSSSVKGMGLSVLGVLGAFVVVLLF